MIVDEEGGTYGTIGGGEMERILVKEAVKALKQGSKIVQFALGVKPEKGVFEVDSKCGGETKIFLDVIKPEPRLIIIGSGFIGKALSDYALKTGFKVLVIDDALSATKENFPSVELFNGPYEDELIRAKVEPNDFVAIVHGESQYELKALRQMLDRKPAYIGLLGSAHKHREHTEQLIKEGYHRADVSKIKGPIGLDINAESPDEIAISILAELISVKNA
jgi:xanthine dehydrogenase accessory factor